MHVLSTEAGAICYYFMTLAGFLSPHKHILQFLNNSLKHLDSLLLPRHPRATLVVVSCRSQSPSVTNSPASRSYKRVIPGRKAL